MMQKRKNLIVINSSINTGCFIEVQKECSNLRKVEDEKRYKTHDESRLSLEQQHQIHNTRRLTDLHEARLVRNRSQSRQSLGIVEIQVKRKAI